jgi:hypothetical protein
MSGTTFVRGSILLVAFAISACAATPEAPTTQSLLDSISAPREATLATCRAANMALVCQGSGLRRTAGAASKDGQCSCADQYDLIESGRR